MTDLRGLSRCLFGIVLFGGVAGACSSADFSAGGNDAGTSGSAGRAGGGNAGASGQGRGGSSASGGTSGSGGGGTLCAVSADCDDGLPCTRDVCGPSGVCAHPPKCGGDEPRCCDGECGECCEHSDCDDGIDCTRDECFAGFCSATPGTCASDDQYCSPTLGCVAREECEDESDCADDDPCTDDSCSNGFCVHVSCPEEGTRCCPGVGCGVCCSDSQCADAAADPCTRNVCDDGSCSAEPLCTDGERCCPNAAGDSATCAACCGADECPDDLVPCTVKVCTVNGCAQQPDSTRCAPGERCDPTLGCTGGAECDDAGDCLPAGVCQTVDCKDGRCTYGEQACNDGQTCCRAGVNVGHCQTCCSNTDCANAAGGSLCCADDAACHECCSDLDCQGNVARAVPPPGDIAGPCLQAFCEPNSRTCQTTTKYCSLGETCCPNGTCSIGGLCAVEG